VTVLCNVRRLLQHDFFFWFVSQYCVIMLCAALYNQHRLQFNAVRCVRACVCVCVCVCVFTHTHTLIRTYVTYVHTHTHTHIRTHTYIYIYSLTHIHTYIHTYMHVYAHTHTHTHTHTHIKGTEHRDGQLRAARKGMGASAGEHMRIAFSL